MSPEVRLPEYNPVSFALHRRTPKNKSRPFSKSWALKTVTMYSEVTDVAQSSHGTVRSPSCGKDEVSIHVTQRTINSVG